jgi:predicted phosphodiesterase
MTIALNQPVNIAIFSDIHGNAIALDAVLADIARFDIDAFWIAGDLVATGPDPASVVQTLRALPNARFVRGNTDRKTLTGPFPSGKAKDLPASPAKIMDLIQSERHFAWTRGAITAVGARDWLAAIPIEQRATLPDGTRVLIVHASPGRDDGPGFNSRMNDADIANALDGCEADLVIAGHTHAPLDISVNGVRIFTLGSVSLPATSDRRAMWTLLRANSSGHELERHFVDYDIDRVIRQLEHNQHPATATIERKFAIG